MTTDSHSSLHSDWPELKASLPIWDTTRIQPLKKYNDNKVFIM